MKIEGEIAAEQKEFCDPLARFCYLQMQREAKDKLVNRASAVDNEEAKMKINKDDAVRREQADLDD